MRKALVLLAAVATFALALAWPQGSARADPLGELQKAYSAYVAHRYDEAEARLRSLLDPASGALKDPGSIADARMVLGAVLVAEGRREEAEKVFEQLLVDQPDYPEDPLRIKQDAIDAFIDARTRIHDRLAQIAQEKADREAAQRAKAQADQQRAALRLATLEQLASEQMVIERHSRWIALVPFGVGQFQNGQNTLGAAFLTGEGLLAVGSVIGGAYTLYYAQKVNDALRALDTRAPEYEARAQAGAVVGDIFAGALLASAIAGVVHAELTFIPQRVEIHRRAIPPLSLAPYLGPGGIGLRGTF